MDDQSLDTVAKIFGGAAVAAISGVLGGALKRRKDRRRIVGTLAREIYLVRDQLRANRELLAADDAAAAVDQEAVRYLSPIVTSAASAAASSGLMTGTPIDVSVWHVSGMTMVVNNAVAAREMYRHTNAAMSNFSRRRVMFNEEVRRDSDELNKSLDKLESGLLRFGWWAGVRDSDLRGLDESLRAKRVTEHRLYRLIFPWPRTPREQLLS